MSDQGSKSDGAVAKLEQHVLPAMAFSPYRVWVLTQSTFTQLVRMRTFYFLLAFVAVILIISAVGLLYQPMEHITAIKRWSFGAIYVFSMIYAIAATALMLPRDLEDRTLYTILSKPVPRFEYLLGKLLGVVLVIGSSILVMFLLMCVLVWMKIPAAEAEAIQQLSVASRGETLTPADIAIARESVQARGVTLSLFWALWAYFLKACVVASATLLISTIASGTLFTIIMSAMVVFIGHFIQLATKFWEQQVGSLGGILSKPVKIVFADLKIFDIVDQVVTGTPFPASQALEMTGLGLFYVAIYTLVAQVIFIDKEL